MLRTACHLTWIECKEKEGRCIAKGEEGRLRSRHAYLFCNTASWLVRCRCDYFVTSYNITWNVLRMRTCNISICHVNNIIIIMFTFQYKLPQSVKAERVSYSWRSAVSASAEIHSKMYIHYIGIAIISRMSPSIPVYIYLWFSLSTVSCLIKWLRCCCLVLLLTVFLLVTELPSLHYTITKQGNVPFESLNVQRSILYTDCDWISNKNGQWLWTIYM